jgi:hypothetical protein
MELIGGRAFCQRQFRLRDEDMVSVESKHSHESDDCPHCKRLPEIAAINLTLLGRSVALFVCPNCGLARAETPSKARGGLRHRISTLERGLRGLKYWVRRS